MVTVKQRIQLKLPYDFGSPWRVDMRKLGCERLAHCLGKEVALWLTRDKKRNPSPKIVQKHPLFDDIPVSIVSGRAGSSKVNIIAANIAMLKNGRERDKPWSTLGFGVPGFLPHIPWWSWLITPLILSAYCLWTTAISVLHLKLGPAPWNVTTQRSYPPKPKVGDISPHAFSDARGPRVQSMAQHKWPGGKVNQGWSYSRNWWFGALTLWPSKMLM